MNSAPAADKVKGRRSYKPEAHTTAAVLAPAMHLTGYGPRRALRPALPGPVANRKASITGDYITGLDSAAQELQSSRPPASSVDKFVYSVLGVDGG